MRLAGGNSDATMVGLDRLTATANYFAGNDPLNWREGVPKFAKLKCQAVYPGIDLIYRWSGSQLEYDFELAPGANPEDIKLEFEGADSVSIDAGGDLVLHTAAGQMVQRKPGIYQKANGRMRVVPGGYSVAGNLQASELNTVAGYSGGERGDAEVVVALSGGSHPGGGALAVRQDVPLGGRGGHGYEAAAAGPPVQMYGNLGPVSLVGFSVGPYDRSRPLIIDPVLSFSTYLGGSDVDEGSAIAVDGSGNVYVAGITDSTNFPLLSSLQPGLTGGQQEAFVVKLDPTGKLVYSTLLGGGGQNNSTSIAVDTAGNAFIAGFTDSVDFPTKSGVQAAKKGAVNSFVTKLSPTGALVYSTYLGGGDTDAATSIAIDGSGNACIAGTTTSADFPTVNAAQTSPGGLADAFVARLDPTGGKLIYSTYLGGSSDDLAAGIAVDPAGNAYITGITASHNFPTASALQAAHGSGVFDAFVTKLDQTGRLVYSTYLGGSGADNGVRIAVDSAGSAYVTGDTASPNFPTVAPLQPALAGTSDAFLAKLNPAGSALVYSTYLGGSGIDGGMGIAVEPGGSAYVTGFTNSTNFPTANPIQAKYGGDPYDAFIARVSPSGSALEYSTYLGGGNLDSGLGLACDAAGNAYVMGLTASTNFPTAIPLQAGYGGGASDVFVAKINPGPIVSSAAINGKKLIVTGSGFDQGARVLINEQAQKTRNDDQNPSATLIAKKGGLQIDPGQSVVIRVQDSSGTLSNEFNFKRPAM
jgi:hypothetical protein